MPVRSPYAGGAMPSPRVERAADPNLPVDSVSVSDETPPPSHMGCWGRAALLLGLSLAGMAAPLAAQAADAVPPPAASVSTTVTSSPDTIQVPGLPVAIPGLPLPVPTLPPLPVPDTQPSAPARVNTTGGPYLTLGTHTLMSSHDPSYAYGEADYGRRVGVDIRKGDWRSQSEVDLGTKLRLGSQIGPADQAGSFSLGGTASEKVTRQLNSALGVYGRGTLGLQGGVGTRFDRDDPLNAFRAEGAVGAEYTTGPTMLYTEPFAETVRGLGGGLSHDQVGLRVGAEHRLSENEQVGVELKASHYDYSDGVHTPAYGVKLGYERKDGHVWWGPEVGFEHRNNDNRISAGISMHF